MNYEKHASRVSQVIAAVAKVSCKHGLWLVARVNKIPLRCFTKAQIYLTIKKECALAHSRAEARLL